MSDATRVFGEKGDDSFTKGNKQVKGSSPLLDTSRLVDTIKRRGARATTSRPSLRLLEQLGRHAVIDAAPKVKVLPRAVRLARGVLFDPRRASLVRFDELLALGLARLLEVGAVVHRVFVVGPVRGGGGDGSGRRSAADGAGAGDEWDDHIFTPLQRGPVQIFLGQARARRVSAAAAAGGWVAGTRASDPSDRPTSDRPSINAWHPTRERRAATSPSSDVAVRDRPLRRRR